jgi:hypothetical protein
VEQGRLRCHVIRMPCRIPMKQFLRKTYLWILALPLALSLLGAASNQAVIIANHDTFPVRISEVKVAMLEAQEGATYTLPDGKVMLDPVHCVMTDKTHLNALADNFDIGGIESVGDMALDLGGWLWTFAPFVWGAAVVRKLYSLAS